jgi:hypothetical protein
MRIPRFTLRLAATALVALAATTGCESTGDGGSSNVSGSVYYGVGFYDPWYYGGYDNDPDIIVTPPIDRPGGGLGRPEQPIARPPRDGVGARPTPMPSIPSHARPMSRGR